jgi:hypothetical protein
MNAKPNKSSTDYSSNVEPDPEPIPIPGPIPGPLPGPIPGPISPIPIPGPIPTPVPWPPDWWRCLRFGPISGRYEGDMTVPTAGAYALDLRVDIDPRYANSPVMDRISGDIYQVYHIKIPGLPAISWRVYRESWIVDAPTVNLFRCRAEISGAVRYWKGVHLATTVQITIPWGTFTSAGPAAVNFTEAGGAIKSYSCARKSDCFRDMVLEVDVCKSTNIAPMLPTYDTHWHNIRPADLPQRVLTIEEAYREAGVGVTINPAHSIVDDSAPGFATWSPAELHDAMETYFSQISGVWPSWNMWGFLAGTFDNSGVGGIMFDAAAAYGGAGKAPERQGFAVFRKHPWFNNLVDGVPANQDQAWAMRHYLYCFVHEPGHAFNLLHSWDKNRPDALSWMNYDWKYDQRNGTDSFWSNFHFRFDDEELIHIRHGDRASVIMGGDPWASGGHLESPANLDSTMDGTVPVELLIRSKGFFEFMEPVEIELRLRNLLDDLSLTLDTRLSPDYGGVLLIIRQPGGRLLEFAPIMCKLGLPEMKTLEPMKTSVQGADRYSELVPLSYGQHGFYFNQPGEYLVRAVYQGAGDLLIISNVHRIRISSPYSQEDDRLAQDMFSDQVGLSLYLDGSRSPFLTKGMDLLQEVTDRKADSALGIKAATVVAHSYSRPFYRIKNVKKPVLVRAFDAEPDKALAITSSGLKFYHSQTAKDLNLPYHNLVKTRSSLLVATGQKAAAKKEVATLIKDLSNRDVNQVVLDQIKTFQESL